MVKKLVSSVFFCFYLLTTNAQQEYKDISSALQAGFLLRGQSGPASVNWINEGNQFSFIAGEEIHTMDPKTLEEKTVFSNKDLRLPGSTEPLSYESFQWSKDSKHLVFRTNFRKIFRNSGISDYYIYDVTARQLKRAAKDARSAELSPDGSRVGMERNGNLFVYDFATAQERPLTADKTSETGTFNGH